MNKECEPHVDPNLLPTPAHELYIVGLLLTFIGGFMDAFTFQLYGGVFANAQTGNIALLGIHLAYLKKDCIPYLVQVITYAFGLFVTNFVMKTIKPDLYFISTLIILISETIVLLIIGFLPLESDQLLVTVLIAIVCSVQAAGFRKVGDLQAATTVCTGNLRSTIDSLTKWAYERTWKNFITFIKYVLISVAFTVGALVSTHLCAAFKQKSIWFCNIVIIIILAVAGIQRYRYTKVMRSLMCGRALGS